MPNIRLNLFNVVLVLNLSRIQALNLLVGPMSTIINRNIPLRFGVIPGAESEDGKSTSLHS
jgi:UDP-glucose:glycoprotein glucosyltransferase